MPYLPGPAGDLEREFEESGGELNEKPVREPGEEGYNELRAKLIDAAATPEERDAVYERYPAYDPELHAIQKRQARLNEANADREKAIAQATTSQELDAAYEEHPVVDPSREAEELAEYRRAVEETTNQEELDRVYERFGKPIPERADAGL